MPNVQQSIGSGTELLNTQRTQLEDAKLQRWTLLSLPPSAQWTRQDFISSHVFLSKVVHAQCQRNDFAITHGIPSSQIFTMLKLQDFCLNLGVWLVCWLVKDRQRRRLEDSYAIVVKRNASNLLSDGSTGKILEVLPSVAWDMIWSLCFSYVRIRTDSDRGTLAFFPLCWSWQPPIFAFLPCCRIYNLAFTETCCWAVLMSYLPLYICIHTASYYHY